MEDFASFGVIEDIKNIFATIICSICDCSNLLETTLKNRKKMNYFISSTSKSKKSSSGDPWGMG